MSSTYIALSEIRHGIGEGEVTVFAPGDAVSGLSRDVMDALIASGSIGKPADLPKVVVDQIDELQSEVDAKDAEIEALKAALAAAAAPKAPVTPAPAPAIK